MHRFIVSLPLFASVLAQPSPGAQDVSLASPVTTAPTRYPPSSAIEEGVSPEALLRLGALVQSFVDGGDVVGAELLVIKNGRSILHEGYGWRDREAESPMLPGGVFCVRSMTKPLIGVAIAMLIEDRLIAIDDPVAEYLPEFDVEGQRRITIRNLLQHTSGLPMSLIVGKDLMSLGDIANVAAMGASIELDFPAGSAFQYSDQGTDTLTAVIAKVSGMPAAEFLQTRLLDPLGMTSSACYLGPDHGLLPRVCTLYTGSRKDWRRFWGPQDPTFFPFFLGSQGMYSSLEDYASFLDLFLRRGKAGKERLLRSRSIRRIQTPGPFPMGAPCGFPGASVEYGSLLQLWMEEVDTEEDAELLAFGHNGSDGTYAWAFPEQKAMVLYFTQSRGTRTGSLVEEALGELLLGAPYNPNEDAPPFEDYLGYYLEGPDDELYRGIVRDGEDLALEIVGRAVVPLVYAGEDRWKLRPEPTSVLAFQRDEGGRVTGFTIGDQIETRIEPDPDLPSGAEVAAMVAKAHRLELLESLGPMRIESSVELPKLGIAGSGGGVYTWPNRFAIREEMEAASEVLAFDGSVLRKRASGAETMEVTGTERDLLLANNFLARFGDWHLWHDELVVVQRIEGGEDEAFILVRTGGTGAPARTLFVDATTGRLRREKSFTYIPNMGRLGATYTFGEFADESGMLLPHRTEISFAHPLLGSAILKVIKIELGADLPPGTFTLED